MIYKRPWIALFSHTGSEIRDISSLLLTNPDAVVYNGNSAIPSIIHAKVFNYPYRIELANSKPSIQEYRDLFSKYKNPLITLHGWMRIIPKEICEEYTIYNGHPALINHYPELKGKDPQKRIWENLDKYNKIGSVIHKVTPGVDEGEIVHKKEYILSPKIVWENEEEFVFSIRKLSLYSWTEFLTNPDLWK